MKRRTWPAGAKSLGPPLPPCGWPEIVNGVPTRFVKHQPVRKMGEHRTPTHRVIN